MDHLSCLPTHLLLLVSWAYFFPWESPLKILLYCMYYLFSKCILIMLVQFLVGCTKKFDWTVGFFFFSVVFLIKKKGQEVMWSNNKSLKGALPAAWGMVCLWAAWKQGGHVGRCCPDAITGAWTGGGVGQDGDGWTNLWHNLEIEKTAFGYGLNEEKNEEKRELTMTPWCVIWGNGWVIYGDEEDGRGGGHGRMTSFVG